MTDQIPAEAYERFLDSFNGDEAGDVDLVMSLLGDTGHAMVGGNDVRAVFDKAAAAILPFLRPEPSEDDEKALASVLALWTGPWLDRKPSLLELILAAGFTRRPMPSRDDLIELLMREEHAPMGMHDPRDGSCTQCPWPLHMLPPEDIADAVLALFEGGE